MAEIYLVTGNENKRNEFSQMMNDEIKVQFIDIDRKLFCGKKFLLLFIKTF